MPLYLVTLEVKLLVQAANASQADNEARYHMDEESENAQAVAIEPITERAGIPHEWRGALPYNGDGETPIEQLLPATTQPSTDAEE